MAVVKMHAMNTHEPLYFATDDLSSAEVRHNVGRQNIPQNYHCPVGAWIYRKGVPSGTAVCLESVEQLEKIFQPDAIVRPCKEDFTVNPDDVKFVRMGNGES